MHSLNTHICMPHFLLCISNINYYFQKDAINFEKKSDKWCWHIFYGMQFRSLYDIQCFSNKIKHSYNEGHLYFNTYALCKFLEVECWAQRKKKGGRERQLFHNAIAYPRFHNFLRALPLTTCVASGKYSHLFNDLVGETAIIMPK